MDWLDELYAIVGDIDIVSLGRPLKPLSRAQLKARVREARRYASRIRLRLRCNHKSNAHKSRVLLRADLKTYMDFIEAFNKCRPPNT
jgi:hypothetical protein